jgi:hypothetical protein
MFFCFFFSFFFLFFLSSLSPYLPLTLERFTPSESCPSLGQHHDRNWQNTDRAAGVPGFDSTRSERISIPEYTAWLWGDNFQFTTGNDLLTPGLSRVLGLEVNIVASSDRDFNQIQIPAGAIRYRKEEPICFFENS